MRTWQVDRRKRTRHLIELGGLVVKSGIGDSTGGNRATIFGAPLRRADGLKSDQREHARALWAAKGKHAFEADPATQKGLFEPFASLMRDNCATATMFVMQITSAPSVWIRWQCHASRERRKR